MDETPSNPVDPDLHTSPIDLSAAKGKGGLRKFLLAMLPFVLIGGSIGYMVYKQGPSEIWASLNEFPKSYLGIALLFLFFDLIADSLRYVTTGAALKTKIGFIFGFRVVLINLFAAFITPGAGGAAPAVSWMMGQRGYDTSRGLSIAFIKGMIGFYVFVPLAAVLAIYAPDSVIGNELIRGVLITSCVGLSVILTIVMCVAIWPKFFAEQVVGRIFGGLGKSLKKARTKGKLYQIGRFFNWLDRILQETAQDFGAFLRGPFLWVLGSFVTTILNIGILMTIAFLLAMSRQLAPGVTTFDVAIVSMLMVVLAFTSPTPGGAGIAELGGEAMFDQVLANTGDAIAVVLIWRTFTCYLPFMMGAFVFSREVQRAAES